MNHHQFSTKLGTRNESRACRWLAILAWLLALEWFWAALAASWGLTPGAFLPWTLFALPLAWLTIRWLRHSGREPGHRLIRVAGCTWVLLCAGIVPFWLYANDPVLDGIRLPVFGSVEIVYGIFPLLVTGMAIGHAWRNSRPRVLE